MCIAMSFDAGFDCEQESFIYLLPKIVKNYVSLFFVESSKNFLSSCTNNKSELSFVIPTGLPAEAVENISGYAWS